LVLDDGAILANNARVYDPIASDGGAVVVDDGSLIMNAGSAIITNSVIGNGGGVYAINGGTVFVDNGAEISDNKAFGGNGGGIYTADLANVTTKAGAIFGNNLALNPSRCHSAADATTYEYHIYSSIWSTPPLPDTQRPYQQGYNNLDISYAPPVLPTDAGAVCKGRVRRPGYGGHAMGSGTLNSRPNASFYGSGSSGSSATAPSAPASTGGWSCMAVCTRSL
jgi:hypothetical protein